MTIDSLFHTYIYGLSIQPPRHQQYCTADDNSASGDVFICLIGSMLLKMTVNTEKIMPQQPLL